MAIKTPKAGAAAAAVLGAMIFWLIARAMASAGAMPLIITLMDGLAAFLGFLAVVRIAKALWLWLRIRALLRPSGLHGRVGGVETIMAHNIGLSHCNADAEGIPVGTQDNKRLTYWKGQGHMSLIAPTEMGKTASFSLNSCMSLGAQRNLVTTGKGAEVAVKTHKYRSQILGQTVIIVDPWGEAARYDLPTHRFNPMGHLVSLAATRCRSLADTCRAIAIALKPEEAKASGENKLFRSMARHMITEVSRYLALCEAEEGGNQCNPVHLYRTFCGAQSTLMDTFRAMQNCPDYDGAVSAAGFRFEGIFLDTPKTAQSFLTEVTDALAIYEPSGILAQSVQTSDFDPTDLKNPDGHGMTIHLVIPPGKALTHGAYIGLALDSLAIQALEAGRFYPRVTLLCDEFEQLFTGKWDTAERILKTGRSAGVNLISIVQELSGYAAYGDKASMWTTQPEVVMCWGVRDPKDAEAYAKRAGKQSVVHPSGSVRDNDDALSSTLKEEGVDMMRPDQFLHMRPFQAAVFYKQNPPFLVDLVHVKSVKPWADYIDDLPDAQPEADFPIRFQA